MWYNLIKPNYTMLSMELKLTYITNPLTLNKFKENLNEKVV